MVPCFANKLRPLETSTNLKRVTFQANEVAYDRLVSREESLRQRLPSSEYEFAEDD